MIRRPPRSTRTDTSFPTRRSSDLIILRGEPMGDMALGHFLEPRKTLLQHALDHADEIEVVFGIDPEPASGGPIRSEEHTSELQSLMRISYAVFCLKKKIYK